MDNVILYKHMVLWTLLSVLGSVCFIFILHQLYLFFRDTLTTPKVKDYIQMPEEKYKQIYDTLSSTNAHASFLNGNGGGGGGGFGDPIMDGQGGQDGGNMNISLDAFMQEPSASMPLDMKSELKHFLKDML